MKALYEKPVTSKQYLHHWMIEYSHTIKILIHWTTHVKLERQYLLFQFINNSLINQSSFNWVLKVMWDCFVSSLLCSVISPENVHYSLNQSDVKIKQICPTMLTIQCVKINQISGQSLTKIWTLGLVVMAMKSRSQRLLYVAAHKWVQQDVFTSADVLVLLSVLIDS